MINDARSWLSQRRLDVRLAAANDLLHLVRGKKALTEILQFPMSTQSRNVLFSAK